MMKEQLRPFLPFFVCFCLVAVRVGATGNTDPTNKYAWAENAGWVNVAPTNSGVTVHFDGTSGYLKGYAWGENIGWLKFKGTAPDFSVRTLAFDQQPQGTPNWWLDLHSVPEGYDAGDGVPAWK